MTIAVAGTYGKAFRKIKKETIDTVKGFAPKIWNSGNNELKLFYAKKLLDSLAALYGVEAPNFEYDKDEGGNMRAMFGPALYDPNTDTVYLFGKVSLVTLLHEFRHHLQNKKEGLEFWREDAEEDARGWSVSLFKKACPKSYKKAVEEGTLRFS